jgi:hypothetical protein
MSRPTGERGGNKPHHHHALVKASATHLFNSGHLDQEQHDEIVKHAERGMAKAKRANKEE